MSQGVNFGVPHGDSSQSGMFASKCLPPLSPLPPSESSRASSSSNLDDISTEEVDVSSNGPLMSPSFPRARGCSNLPPRRGHRRSNSDISSVFSDMVHSSPQMAPITNQGNFRRASYLRDVSGNDKFIGLRSPVMDGAAFRKSNGGEFGDVKSEGEFADELFNSLIYLDNLNSTRNQDIENGYRDSTTISRHATNPTEGVKRSASGDIVPPSRHHRSLSMDSAMLNYDFGDEHLKTPFSTRSDHLSPSNSVTDNSCKLNLDFGTGEFNDLEMKKLMKDERLAEIANSDPKRAKRILANRLSAARSKERKLRYISELEQKVQTLQSEATILCTQVTILQKEYADLSCLNNELKFRVQAMEQHEKLKDDLNTALSAEIQRLKLGKMELRDETVMPGAGSRYP